jgi:RNA polymerase-binding transcription factor DksA
LRSVQGTLAEIIDLSRGHVSCSKIQSKDHSNERNYNRTSFRPTDKASQPDSDDFAPSRKRAKAGRAEHDWLDQAAYASRVSLLDRLNDWYATEIRQIDKAIERIESNRYGF